MIANTKQERWRWVLSERDFCLNVLRKRGMDRSDAEDVFSNLLVRWVAQDGMGQLPDTIHRGFLLFCLFQVKQDFLRKKNAPKRGGGVPHLPLDESLVDAPGEGSGFSADEREAALPVLDRLAGRAKGRRRVLLGVMRRMLASGRTVGSWTEGFTPAERREFMRGTGEGEGDDDAARKFAKQVSRTFSEILKEIGRTSRDGQGREVPSGVFGK